MINRLFSRASVRQLKYDNIVHSPEDRFRLQVVSSGVVHLELNVVTRSFQRQHVMLS